jgi:hypothetical protein
LALVETCSMPRLPSRVVAMLAALLIPLAAIAAGAATVDAAQAPPTTTPTSVTSNPFIPPNKDVSTCVSANPQPGCGSKAQGGWRQTLVFGVVVAGLAFIGWRVVTIVRRNRREFEASGQR